MYIGIKDGHIVAYSDTINGVKTMAMLNDKILDAIEETVETILPYYNTKNDGYYFKESEVPPLPIKASNERARWHREIGYTRNSDGITSHISALRDKLLFSDYKDDDEKRKIETKISKLYQERKEIREKIKRDYQYIQEKNDRGIGD
jgi:adenylosuccinate synthase